MVEWPGVGSRPRRLVYREPPISHSRLIVAVLALLLVVPAPARAEDEAPDIDYLDLLARTQDELSFFTGKQGYPGHDGALAYIRKTYVVKRAKRAQSYFRELQKPARWVMDEDKERALSLNKDSWSPFIQRLGKAYSTLATARDGYKKINVSPKSAIKNWVRRNPEPNLHKKTPAEVALEAIRRSIRLYIASGKAVPYWMYQREKELIAEALIERRELEALHAQWLENRKAAIEAIHAAVAETKRQAELEMQRLELHLRNMQELVAELQAKEEARLRARVAEFADDATLAAAAKKDFEKMANGRRQQQRYDTAKSSKWSSLVRRGWMQPRSHLVSAIRSAAGRKARAEKEAAEKAAAEESGEAKPEEGGGEDKPEEGGG